MMQLIQRVKDQQGITLTMAWMCIACATLLVIPISIIQMSQLPAFAHPLDFEEKAVLREFIIQRKNVLALPMRELAVSNLLESGVLVPAYETQEIKGSGRIIKLSIAVDAREQLTHKVLGLPVGKLTDNEANQLKAARPEYARTNYFTFSE